MPLEILECVLELTQSSLYKKISRHLYYLESEAYSWNILYKHNI